MVKLVCISDLHTYHRQVSIPLGDILVVAGDLTYDGDRNVIEDLNEWFGELKRTKIIEEVVCIAGNHDLLFDPTQKTYDSHAKEIFTNCHYLQDSSVILKGLKFYGSPATPFFRNWGFNYHSKAIRAIWDAIPSDTDVLVTHGPPKRVMDKVERENWNDKVVEHVGCPELSLILQKVKPKVHIFGHIHGGYGQLIRDGIHYVNASTCDEDYKPINPPLVITVE